MSTITKEFTKEQLIAAACSRIDFAKQMLRENPLPLAKRKWEIELSISEIALASLEAEAVACMGNGALYHSEDEARADARYILQPLYTAPPAPVSVPDDIDTRMKNAGMLSAAEIIAGQPIDAFMKHAGVVDLESLLKWSEMRRAEFLRMQAKYELGDNQKDDMYEWVISHVAAFSELHVNIRAAMLQGAEPVKNHDELREKVRREHAEWSQATFGDVGPVGPLKHLSKEALEAAAEPGDLSEWADMQFLLWDAQRRAGISDGEITAAMEEKLKVNIARQWPEPKDGEPRLHIKPAPRQEVKP